MVTQIDTALQIWTKFTGFQSVADERGAHRLSKTQWNWSIFIWGVHFSPMDHNRYYFEILNMVELKFVDFFGTP